MFPNQSPWTIARFVIDCLDFIDCLWLSLIFIEMSILEIQFRLMCFFQTLCTNRSRWTMFEIVRLLRDYDWSDDFEMTLVDLLILKMTFRLMRFFQMSFTHWSLWTMFEINICLRCALIVNVCLKDFHWFVDFQNEISSVAFLSSFIYK